ncbi:hypothetical protein [Lentzea sp.]|uniref:hypothetical protein n=1 Tax=Lentzea sp. TaxID=56099 RepID=UPI002BEA56FA|nr:hypothetical protein [Lentzea sp.]HUQ59544.1 hypothetical protein [Lentzea sp.]
MIVVGQGPAPYWVWISVPRVEWIRARTAMTGLAVVWLALVSGIVLVAVGVNLPSSHDPFARMGLITAGLSAFWGLLSGGSLIGVRTCARDGYLDVNNAPLLCRVLGVLWGSTIVCAMIAWLLEVALLSDEARPVPFTVGAAVYLAALAIPVVLGGVAFLTARKVLRVSP